MKKESRLRCVATLALLGGPLTAAFATDGYFPHGMGMKAKGMGGASVTATDTAFAGTNNPAAAAFSGNRVEGGLDIFMPNRSMSRTGAGPMDAEIESGSKTHYIPEFGVNKTINDKVGAGIAVYGNGGMNTDYAGGEINCGMGPANALCGPGGLGVDLMQLIVAPTVGYKINENHAVGASALLVYQQFEANGLQAFTPMSTAPGSATNNGYDRSTGLGVRLGYLGKFSDKVTVGASYSPKIKMKKFDKYAGLFAGGGSFDIPENYAVGVAFQATPSVSVAMDYQRINYGGVAAIGNPSTNIGGCMMGDPASCLGGASGPGFGWSNVDVFKIGAQWQATPKLTLRAGFNKSKNPIQSRDVTFNIVAPGVIKTHYTLGGTYALSPTTELTLAYMHAPKQTVTGASLFNALFPGMNASETIRMSQNSLGVQFAWRF